MEHYESFVNSLVSEKKLLFDFLLRPGKVLQEYHINDEPHDREAIELHEKLLWVIENAFQNMILLVMKNLENLC